MYLDFSLLIFILKFLYRSMSSDGKAWTVINRPGFHITNREKGMYSKLMIDSPDEPFPWKVYNFFSFLIFFWSLFIFINHWYDLNFKAGVKEQVTCWVGVVPGHFPNLAKCLGELYLDNGLTCGSKCFWTSHNTLNNSKTNWIKFRRSFSNKTQSSS